VSGDYLWDRSGPPDPAVQRLERLLGTLEHRTGPLAQPGPPATIRRSPLGSVAAALVAAAALLLALGGLLDATRPEAWEVTRLADVSGPDRIKGKDRLEVGRWLETDAVSRARIRVGRIGVVEVEPRTRIGLLDAGRRSHRMSLARGVMHASIWAPPMRFFVETASAQAVDLGCAYTLEVDEAGAGTLRVESGWVGFQHKGRESFVPRGAVCLTRPGIGPGTPHYEDADPELRAALSRLDFDATASGADLRIVLDRARPRDVLSLWHLLARRPASERGPLYDRMASLVPPPEGVTRDGILQGDREMLDAWWEELDLGSAGFWRLWKAPWPPGAR
jgi:hypothetical protein